MQVIAALWPVVADRATCTRDIRRAIADHILRNLTRGTRSDVLAFCANSALSSAPILPSDTLAAIANAIIEICCHWRWL